MSIYYALSLLFVATGLAMSGELSAQEKEGSSPMSVNKEADPLSAYPQTGPFASNVDWHKGVGENEVRMSWFLRGDPGIALVCTANPTTYKVVTAREVYAHATQSETTRKLSDAQAGTLGNLIKQLPPSAKQPELKNLIIVTISKKGKATTYLYDRLDMPRDIVRLYDVTGAYVDSEVKTVTLTYEECLAIATKKAEELSTEKSPVKIWEEKTTEKEFGWVFYPETKAFLETKDKMKRAPGISPILVNKFDSTCEIAPSSVKFETFLADFEAKFLKKNKQ